MSLFHRCFSNILLVKTNNLFSIASKNQLPISYISETLVENGLNKKATWKKQLYFEFFCEINFMKWAVQRRIQNPVKRLLQSILRK